MFIALRDLRFARGRFALLGSVIALMTLMVVLLSGLTAGLGAASTSALAALPVDEIAFQKPADGQSISFATSTLTPETRDTVADRSGVDTAYALGVSTTRLESGEASTAVTVMGTDPRLYPALLSGDTAAADQAAVTEEIAEDQELAVGDPITLGGQELTVAAITESTSFNHLPVVYTPIDTWQEVSHADTITAVALTGHTGDTAGTTVATREDAFAAVGGYASEQSSLNLMRGLLLGVSALIVGAFFTVWTMQRAGDLAVVRAIGAGRRYLLRDALGQAAVVLVIGAAVGGGIAAGLGALATQVMPFVLSLDTIGVPLAAMIIVGVLGASVSVRRVSTVDPLTALGASR